MSINLTWLSYVIAGIVVYYMVLFLISVRPARQRKAKADGRLRFVLVTPAHNEEAVLESTIRSHIALGHDHLIMIVNDGSTDETGEIAHRFARAQRNVIVLDRVPPQAGTGKSDALNHAYEELVAMLQRGDDRIAGYTADEIVVAIVDADGLLAPDCLEVVAPWFAEPATGSVQIAVRIGNAMDGLLCRLQDMEFVAFSYFVQIARDRLGSSGLGGNGQFTRLSALRWLGASPWNPRSLTEDLDLGLRLVQAGWKTGFCNATEVAQQGLDRIRPLLRQRTRWIQGHYQCWKYIPGLTRARGASVAARLDLVNYLILVTSVSLIALDFVFGWLGVAHVIEVHNRFLDFLPLHWRRYTQTALALGPVCAFVYTYQCRSRYPLRWWEVPAFAAVFSFYTYLWTVATGRAFARIALRRWSWVKTPRLASCSLEG